VTRRDGPFGDYSQAPASEQPDPGNVIEVDPPAGAR
jgi:enoyl-CoA hydratase